jgi:hypothetical protein
MDHKAMAAQAVPAAPVVGLMVQLAVVVIRHQLPHRKATMVATAREAGPLRSAVEAVEQELPAERELLAARQEMEERGLPAASLAPPSPMLAGAVVSQQSLGARAMVVLAAEALEMHRAPQTLVAVVVPTPAAARAS